ncbi:class I adenylate-forming enzyme family protein [Ferrimicrobium acidiphilum]|jgi:fatty-acyl-CoA synthase|uniref:class I adenylate-forming enzyme family protein n=1 Tax=Ferrimicrobium acidiphilum TaxID=121039 RepID=UPI0023F26CC9|nr:class I adenylate-forming enzyme family protein [Ferrimicrobium acidiphilum]MCL5052366.1 acyl--CoA ligase [Gammaproteobacteria bacterium]
MKTPSERRTWLIDQYSPWPRRTLGDHFTELASHFGDRPLLATPDRSITYAELVEESRSLARAMMALGVRRRDHVALLLGNEPEFIFLSMAVSMVGGVVVPLNTMLHEDELDYLLEQSDSKWVFLHQTVAGIDHEKAVASIVREHQRGDKTLAIENVVVITTTDAPVQDGFQNWEHFKARATSVTEAELDARREASRYPDEVVNIIYTSGTTGLPKGVMLTSDMLLRCGYSTALSRAFEEGRRIFTPLPLYHVFAFVEGLMAVSFVGGTIITMPNFKPSQAMTMVQDLRAHDILCVPTILLAMVTEAERASYELSELYALMCAAAPAPVPLWERAVAAFGLTEMVTGYGGTEASAATVHTELGDSLEVITTKVGRIKPGGPSGLEEFGWANSQYKVIDPDSGEDLADNEIGELAVRGNFVTRGYYRKPDETARHIDKDGWFRTGDLGRIDENGYLEFHGRANELYKVSGENVSPKEIEEVISRHPAVNQAYVVGVPSPVTTETGVALIELRYGERASRREMIEWCREHLAKFKVPRYYFFVEASEWPMTGTGKVQKYLLAQLARERISDDGTVEEDLDA